jgi:hypothetical protein
MHSRRTHLSATLLAAAIVTTGCDFIKGILPGGKNDLIAGVPAGSLIGVLKNSAKEALKDYIVLVQDSLSKNLFTTTVGADGKFDVKVLGNGPFIVNFLDAEANYRGTLAVPLNTQVALAGGSGGAYHVAAAAAETVVTGIKASEFGDVTLGEDGQAKAADPTKVKRDEAFKAAASGGVGIGFKITGTADAAYDNVKNSLDSDGDGVVDFLDADDDNDGRRDSIDGKANGARPDGLPDYRTVNSFGFFTNYPTNLGDTGTNEAYILTIEIQAKPDYYGKLKEAKLAVGPGYAKAAQIGNRSSANGTMQPVGTWQSQGMKLFKYEGSDGIKRIEGFMSGNQAVDLSKKMKVGDVFRFELSYSDGTTEILTHTLDTIFDTSPANVKINGTAATSATVTVAAAPTLTWDPLKDNAGKTLKGLTYAIEIRKNNEPTPTGRVDLGVDKTEFKWADHLAQVAFTSGATYELGIKAQAPGGNTSTNGIRVKAQ